MCPVKVLVHITASESFLTSSTKTDGKHNAMIMAQHAIIPAEAHRRKRKANEDNKCRLSKLLCANKIQKDRAEKELEAIKGYL